jgi:hypothetical protein
MPSSDILAGFCAPGEVNGGPLRTGGGTLPLGEAVEGPLSGDNGIFFGERLGGTLPVVGRDGLITFTGLGVAGNNLLFGLAPGGGLDNCEVNSCTGFVRLDVEL